MRIEWHGVSSARRTGARAPTRSRPRCATCTTRFALHAIFNAYWEPLAFALPRAGEEPWRRCIDTALDSPDDIRPWKDAPAVSGKRYQAQPRSVVLLARGL